MNAQNLSVNSFNIIEVKNKNTSSYVDNSVSSSINDPDTIVINCDDESENEKIYKELLEMEQNDIIFTKEKFVCQVCCRDIEIGEGIRIKECLHEFCFLCIQMLIEINENIDVQCPFINKDYNCKMNISEREIKSLVTPEIYEKYLQKCLRYSEQKLENSFHCQTPDCNGWFINDCNDLKFPCPVCNKINCLTCKDIHEGIDCRTYQDLKKVAIDFDGNATKKNLETAILTGESMQCPSCRILISRTTGCDGVQCSLCKTDICWAKKSARWGPGGKGDNSGGCQCNVNGKKCTPQCRNCH